MKTYRRLSQNDRDEIAVLLARKWPIRKIAFHLSRPHSTISRELKRNKSKEGYGPIRAHVQARTRQRQCHLPHLKLASDKVLRDRVTRELRLRWSPEIIAGRLKRENGYSIISYEAIYRWVYSQAKHLIPFLVYSHRHRRHRTSQPWPKRLIPQRVSINARPEEINRRQVAGHWETDLVWGSSCYALQVLVERQTRFVKLKIIPNKTAQASYEALCSLLSPIPAYLRQSITYDNGIENILHVEINQKFSTKSFFCHPYHSWEKGTVENTNGLIRRFLPKKTDLRYVSLVRILRIQHWLNSRPRKCLQFQTAEEALSALVH